MYFVVIDNEEREDGTKLILELNPKTCFFLVSHFKLG